jgi:fucose permease
MANANSVQGILQAFYSLGATASPLVATTMITQADLPWYTWYHVMVSYSLVLSEEYVTDPYSDWCRGT